MNPLLILLAAGYGYLSGNPKARRDFFATIQKMAGKGVDALNNIGGDADVPTADADEEPRTE